MVQRQCQPLSMSSRAPLAGAGPRGGPAMDSARGVPLVMGLGLALGRGLGLIEIVDLRPIAHLHGPADRLLVASFARTSRPAVDRFRNMSLRLVVFRTPLAGLMRRPGFRSGGLLRPPAIPLTRIGMSLIRLPRHGFARRVLVLAIVSLAARGTLAAITGFHRLSSFVDE